MTVARSLSLTDMCINYIAGNIENMIDHKSFGGKALNMFYYRMDVFNEEIDMICTNDNVFLSKQIAEQLLTRMSYLEKLDDITISIFVPRFCNLSNIFIPNAKHLSRRGFKKLKDHKVSEIKVVNVQLPVSDLINCFGEWTQKNLKSLDVTDGTFVDKAKHYCFIIVPISKLKSLRCLSVRGTEFNNHGLEIVVEDLPCIESIDISETRISHITPLKKIKHRLKYLSMHNVTLSEANVSTIAKLSELRLLDISEEKVNPFNADGIAEPTFINNLFKEEDILPNLISLDISGHDNLDSFLFKFIREHTLLKFLGVVNCECNSAIAMFTDPKHAWYLPELQVAGTEDERQIILSLQLYMGKQTYIQKALYKLFRMTQDNNWTEPRPDIIKLVLAAMKKHENIYGIQMAATACVYNLTKGNQSKKLHPALLRKVVKCTLMAMEKFPIHIQLQKNALLTLCSDRILQEVDYDKFRCVSLVMDCLCSFEDQSMNRMCVAICSILAAKIPTSQTSILGANPPYMLKLLGIVRRKTQSRSHDMTLKFTLSALWNLTDESPETCQTFIHDDGLTLYQKVLEEFSGTSSVETKVLGLINNIAEVPSLRHHLCANDFPVVLGKLLESEHIDVSYFAAGIISHLACHDTISSFPLLELLSKLGTQVQKWQAPEGEMVAYRSFRPFEPLLICEHYEVNLWAVWAIQHVCARNPTRYCPMLEEERGGILIRNMLNDRDIHPAVLRLVQSIVAYLDTEVTIPRNNVINLEQYDSR